MDMHSEGVIFRTHPGELARRTAHPHPPFLVVDVRPREEWERERIAGSISSSPTELAEGLPAGTTSQTEFFVVGRGQADATVRAASLALRRHGARRCVELAGGLLEWRQLGYPLEGERQQAA